MPDLSADFDGFEDRELIDLSKTVREAWAPRDDAIGRAKELYDQSWHVPVPKAWKQTAETQHSSLSKEIPHRVIGTITLREPVFSRPNPGVDFTVGQQQNQVERWFQAKFSHDRRHALVGRDMFAWNAGQLVHKGAVCNGSIWAPNAWADGPLFLDGDQPKRVYWRDSTGQPTEDERAMDYEATSRAYGKAMDQHYQTAPSPLVRRILPTEQCYPLIVEGRIAALFIVRQSTLLELNAAGFAVDTGLKDAQKGQQKELLEVVTPNRCRYFLGNDPIAYAKGDSDGTLTTDYGFVPYSYRAGLDGGDMDYGSFGVPLLSLVDSNLRTIDTLRTYAMNAVRMASFTSFQIEYVGDQTTVASMVETESGKKLTTFEFKSGTIMDFGPGRRVVPLTHPGLNGDFWKVVQTETDEVHRIIPRTLSGVAESSGFNTVQSSSQAKSIFGPLYQGEEALEEELAIMDLHHLSERTPGPVYLDAEAPRSAGSSKRPKWSRISLSKAEIGDYYAIHASIDREPDRITLGQWAANLLGAGIGDEEWASDQAGIVDYEDMKGRQARDRVLKSPIIMQALEQRAVKKFGLQQAMDEAVAMQRIQQGPDGMPMVKMPDGRMAGPGVAQNQAVAGLSGGMNGAAAPGLPNMNSTNNPQIATPQRTETGRGRSRRRGGAIPGAPQRQGQQRPVRQPVA